MSKFSRFLKKNPALKYREFRWYLLIRFTGIFALTMQITTLFYWIYQLTNSELKLGMIGLAEVIPAVGMSLISGHIVDKSEKRQNLLNCFLGYITLAALLFYFTLPSTIAAFGMDWGIGIIYALVFIGGIIRSFLGPSSFALLGHLLPKRHYANASSWSSLCWQIGATLGPLTGGLIIAGYSANIALLMVTFILIIPIFALLKIRKKEQSTKPNVSENNESALESIQQGLKFVWNTPIILGALVLDLFSVLFGGAIALLPVFQKEILQVNEVGYGILRASPGIGAILCLIIITLIPLQKQSGYKLFISVACFGICIILFGLSTNFYFSCFVLILSGMFDAVSVVIRGIILQLYTPMEMRGRVASVNTMFISSSNELGDFESGVMAHYFGPVRAVVIGGFLTLSVVAITYSKFPLLRRFQIKDVSTK